MGKWLRRYRRKNTHYQEVHFEPRDLWIGAYFKRDNPVEGVTDTRVYICIVPMLPIVLGRVSLDD